ncbi:MAG: hypothetical protein OER22_08950 [Gammaproteobacteria bacterium]|nr:hypothetical protein [Gammaproteobacteria bacterium]
MATDGNGGKEGPDLGVEAVAVHAEIGWRVAKAHEPRLKSDKLSVACHRRR